MARLHPRISRWFREAFGSFTEPQRGCIPPILDGRSVLLTAPTGSGKTLAAFLGVIDFLIREREESRGGPAGVRALYISPLRALSYDIQKNLERPLREIGLLEGARAVRLGLRTGDTDSRERARQRRHPPDILLTTPESLAVLLAQSAWRPALAACRFVVVDELHALAENKRGTHLALSLERLEHLTRERPSRVGLSATLGEPEVMARFLAGAGRDCVVIAGATMARAGIAEVLSPLSRNPYPPQGRVRFRVLKDVARLVQAKRSTLIFANTRGKAEQFCVELKMALPEMAERIEVHHGSLDRSVRLDVEDRFKNGDLRVVVSSTSLEMGVDIGSIDLVILLSAPKSVTRAIQRIGRSGHQVGAVSHGVLVAQHIGDLVECAVTARLIREGRLDPIRVPLNCADVLAQHLVGLAMSEPGIRVDDAFELVRRATPYQDLERSLFDRVVDYLEGGGRALERAYADTFGKIVSTPDGHGVRRLFPVSDRVARDYLLNVGTIPDDGTVDVFLRGRRLGAMDEYFVRGLRAGDVFILAGKLVRFMGGDWAGVRVERAHGERPTVPVWSSHRTGLTRGLAEEVALLRAGMDDRLNKGETSPDPANWLVESFDISLANAWAIVRQFEMQRSVSAIPRPGLLLIELFRDPDPPAGKAPLSHYFFHTLIGRLGNDALSRIVAWRVGQLVGGNALVTVNDYGFVLTLRRNQELPVARWRRECFPAEQAEADLAAALRDSELVRGQFRAVAQTGLMVPRRLPGADRQRKQVRFGSDLLYRVLAEHEPDHPLLEEAYRQATHSFLDGERAAEFLRQIAAPDAPWEWRLIEVPAVTPFAFGLFASRVKEAMMFEDPDAAIERLFQQFTTAAGDRQISGSAAST